MRKLSQIGNQP